MMGTLRNGNNEDVFLTSWKAYEGKDFLNLNLNLNPTTTTTNTSHLQHDPHCNIPSSLVRNLVLDYLAMECYEKTLLKLVHAHPFVQHCLEEKVVALPFFSSSSSMTSSSTMNRITTPTKKGPVSCSSSLKWINTGGVELQTSSSKTSIESTSNASETTMAQTPSGFSFHLTPFLTYALKTLRFRKHVSSLILTGQLQTAQHVCQQVFPPHFFPSPPHVAMSLDDLRFQFDTHQFLEWVRAHQPTQALQFSHTVMLAAHLTSTHPDVVSTLSDMFALIAYPIPAQSPLASYVDLDRRKAFAQWINRFILKLHRPDPENLLTPSTSSSSHSTTGGESTLQKVIQQWCVVHELLE